MMARSHVNKAEREAGVIRPVRESPKPETSLGRPLFDVLEEEYQHSSFRRSKVRLKWATSMSGVGLVLLALAFSSMGRGSLNLYIAYGAGTTAMFSVAVWQSSSLARLNRFGIFEGGIAPPRRTRGRAREGRLVIPYSSLSGLEFKTIGDGLFPKSHYGVVLRLSSGEVLEFDATEIYAQTRWDARRTAQAQLLLGKLAEEFRVRWSTSGGTRRWLSP